MRFKPTLLLVFVLIAAAAPALSNPTAPPPINGTYISTDLGGGVLAARFSESWAGSPPGHGQVGNTLLVSSVDGPLMGTQWELWCSSISSPPMLLTDARDSTGTGETAWQVDYDGGFFWLSADGPWATPGAIDYTGNVESLVSMMTYIYEDGEVVGAVSSVQLSGTFDPLNWEGSCVEYTITGLSYIGDTNQGPKPPDYPAFMAQGCGPWPAGVGAWGDVTGITINIFNCTETPVKNATWGEIRTLYR